MIRPTTIIPEIRKQNRIPFIVWNPRAVPSVVMGHFCSLPTQERKWFSHIALHRCRNSSPHETGSPSNLESVCSTKLRVFATQSQGRRWTVVRVLDWDVGTRPICGWFFFDRKWPTCSVSQNILYRTGSGPHVPGETSRHRPPTALKLGSEDSQLSGA